ncbi:related to cel1 protein precursor [Cephalotrichum gorgonifer]|uniref:lytic cellulose monooxygenase (C4-dehydrogenating) n=1 Tax=Cephalotrichum gorgonifer TaxID=2041049 RepID=A0AAE8MTK5_9PEZI|nr:related to cel1 protein precursor [Cephalotrichum gorgonifer]
MKFLAAAAGTLLPALVAGHGYVNRAIIGGEEYEFYIPERDPYMNPKPERVSRAIPGNGPVQDVSLIDLQCNGYTDGNNPGSSPAPLHAPVQAGSTVKLFWTLWPESHVGPTITYMARCPDDGCDNWEPGTDAVWFKIQEEGRDGTSNNWAVTPLMTDVNAGVEYTIPACIKPGYYLVRHEIIALHSAWEYPGAQFYPGCHQLEVTGSGNTSPSGLVSFPGAYDGADPGITYNAYTATEYTIPGPAVFTC